MAKSTTTTSSHSTTKQSSHSESREQSKQKSQSESRKFLDQELVNQIMSGLQGYMTDEEIAQYAENLLNPQKNAAIEASQQNYETTQLAKQQEIENLAASLSRAIAEQEGAYKKSLANVETAALARGMGRSSYTLQTLANQGDNLAKAIRSLTDENARQSAQIQNQITLAAQQNAQTQGRVNMDYASQLAAKVQELRQQQRDSYNQNYMTAVSGALGTLTTGTAESTTTGVSNTTGTSSTDSTSTSVTTTSGGGGGKNKNGTKTYRDPIPGSGDTANGT